MDIEARRRLYEEIDELEQVIADMLAEETAGRSRLDQLIQEHHIKALLEHISRDSQQLLAQNPPVVDNSTNDDDPLAEFYSQLRILKDHHRRIPVEAAAAAESEVALVCKGCQPKAETIEASFSGEEALGKFLDLHQFHRQFCNLRGAPLTLDYLGYLDLFWRPKEQHFLPHSTRQSALYREYLEGLIGYLEDWFQRALPLVDLGRKQQDEIVFYCDNCERSFANEAVYRAHFSGKKHERAANRMKNSQDSSERKVKETKGYLSMEGRLEHLADLLNQRSIIAETKAAVELKQSRSVTERLEDEEFLLDADTKLDGTADENGSNPTTVEPDGDSGRIYNPLNLPLDWDGKPIPYWLWKLHGLGVSYGCEICGNYTYKGRRAFDMHFNEWRHVYGLKCLGIPNTRHFFQVTVIQDAIACKI